MRGISEKADDSGFITYEAYPARPDNRTAHNNDIVICSNAVRRMNEIAAHYTGFNGCFAVLPTLRLLKRLSAIKPDILHFHNLHDSYINLPLLFRYVKKNKISVVWTLHDCWAFTGQCTNFTLSGCDRWQEGCGGCNVKIDYPKSIYDNTAAMYSKKKKWFTGVDDLTIVTPSQWLIELVGQSFLKNYPSMVISNGIDTGMFKPTYGDFREKYGLSDKFVILGVAFNWCDEKGLDVFIELSRRLDDRYRIVLVGTDDKTDSILPDSIISIHRTQNQAELAEIYTAADIFANPTRQDNFPTVNMEAIACGTPVITFRTGGSPESLNADTGYVVDYGDIDGMYDAIRNACENHVFDSAACISHAAGFSMQKRFTEYVDLYRQIIERKQQQ